MSRLLAIAALALATPALAQAPPATKAQAPAPAADPVLATVGAEPIRRSEVERLLGSFAVPPGSEQRAYDSAMELLINTKLLAAFLKEQRITTPPAEIDAVVKQYEDAARGNNSSLAAELATNNTTLEEFRDRIARSLQWKTYVMGRATDAELKKYAEANRDVFAGTQVRASHILVRVEPDTSEADKQKAIEKLTALKAEIESGKTTFANAANTHSEDPGNQATPSGGDLGFFPRKGQFIEPFAAAAFGLKKGELAGPIETEYGLHLISLTDRREGKALEFEQIKDAVLNQYAADLQEQIVTAQREKSQAAGTIKIEPMPPGLVKPEIPTQPAPAAAPAAAPASAPPAAAPGGNR